MAVQYLGNTGGPSGASLIVGAIKKSMDDANAQKMALAQSLIQSGAYQPVAGGQQPGMLGRIGQGLLGPQVGGPNMNIGGQNFQFQDQATKMANLQAQIAAIKGINGQNQDPSLGNTNGLPPSLPGVQVNPKIDPSTMTASPDVTMTTPLQQAEYQSRLLDINKKQQDQKDQQESDQYAGLRPEDIRAQIKQKSPTESAILDKLARGDLSLKDLPTRNPAMVKKITGDLAIAYPGFDEQKIAARRKTKMDFTPGGSIGKQATIAGTMIQHMYELRKTIEELGDTGFKPWNQLKQTASRTFGAGSAPLKKYDTIKNAISGEWDKYLRAGGSAEAGIDRILKSMDEADTPEAQKASLDEMANLMSGRMGQYVDEWKASFDQQGDPKIPSYVMSTRTRYALNKMGLDDVIKGVENPEGSAGVSDQKSAQSTYNVGQIIPMNGKKYRVTGGDPNDPDIEEVK